MDDRGQLRGRLRHDPLSRAAPIQAVGVCQGLNCKSTRLIEAHIVSRAFLSDIQRGRPERAVAAGSHRHCKAGARRV